MVVCQSHSCICDSYHKIVQTFPPEFSIVSSFLVFSDSGNIKVVKTSPNPKEHGISNGNCSEEWEGGVKSRKLAPDSTWVWTTIVMMRIRTAVANSDTIFIFRHEQGQHVPSRAYRGISVCFVTHRLMPTPL